MYKARTTSFGFRLFSDRLTLPRPLRHLGVFSRPRKRQSENHCRGKPAQHLLPISSGRSAFCSRDVFFISSLPRKPLVAIWVRQQDLDEEGSARAPGARLPMACTVPDGQFDGTALFGEPASGTVDRVRDAPGPGNQTAQAFW